MQAMSTERLSQGFTGGMAHLKEKVTNAVSLLKDVRSQARVLTTMQKELLRRENVPDTEPVHIETFIAGLEAEILGLFSSGGADGNETEASYSRAAENAELKALKEQIASMKASRDKLLLEIDRLSVELETVQIQQQLRLKQQEEQKTLAAYWKQQTSRKSQQIDRLKDMLDETAEVCGLDQPEQATEFLDAAKIVEGERQRDELMSKLLHSEERNTQLKDTWLPALRQLETRLLELNAAAADAFE